MRLLTIWTSVLLIFTFSGCLKEGLPVIENIKKGSKWNLRIGDSFEDIYKELQELGIEKDFTTIGLVYRPAYSEVSEFRESLPFYHILTVQSTAGWVDCVIISLENNQVSSLTSGGALPAVVDQWPQSAMEGAIIRKGDTILELYTALEAIHQTTEYQGYQFLLPDKPLDLLFDPDMRNYNEWAFTFFNNKSDPGIDGRSQVRLFFKAGKLDGIHHVYDEFDVVH